MRLRRLEVAGFGAIRSAEVELGPGLNVLYGPNDLGKSTLVEAIRLALLLPYTSSHADGYVPWSGSRKPVVELVFDLDQANVWSVRKEFGARGSATLRWSKNGRDWEEIAKARGVDGKLREILRWGIPEPGGKGAPQGLPASFLATALLSTQADVMAVLRADLSSDRSLSGKDEIAAVLQAIAQDPLFLALLKDAQAQRDAAFTEKGLGFKTAKGSPVQVASERLADRAKERDDCQKAVEQSSGIEGRLKDLQDDRDRLTELLVHAEEALATARELAAASTVRAAAMSAVEAARADAAEIGRLRDVVVASEARVERLAGEQRAAAEQVKLAQATVEAAERVHAEAVARAASADGALADTVARQQAEIRRSALVQGEQAARQQVLAVEAVGRLVDAEIAARAELDALEADLGTARTAAGTAAGRAQAAEAELARCELLTQALAVDEARKIQEKALVTVRALTAAREKHGFESQLLAGMRARRDAIVAPSPDGVAAIRKLWTELASAKGALEVGLVITVTPAGGAVELELGADGEPPYPQQFAERTEIEARGAVELLLPGIATLEVAGGGKAAQDKVRRLEERWAAEAVPHLLAAGAGDVTALDRRVTEATGLDLDLAGKTAEVQRLEAEIRGLSGAGAALAAAEEALTATRAALGDAPFEPLANELGSLGRDPRKALAARADAATRERRASAKVAQELASELAVLGERSDGRRKSWTDALERRDAARSTLPTGAAEALATAVAAREQADEELKGLESASLARKSSVDTAVATAERELQAARAAHAAKQQASERWIGDHGAAVGTLAKDREAHEARDLVAAEARLAQAEQALAALPVPTRTVTPAELAGFEVAVERAENALAHKDREVHGAQALLQHVGGSIARERLHDAAEACELAERNLREVEAEYQAWRLLLDQLKAADAAQASNLGQALAPAIAAGFAELTARRYQGVQLTPTLGTDGVLVGGQVRATDALSVGTREQLSTLYRMCLAEYLHSTLVLDDQLVQSDGPRMDWFRGVLAAKARLMQILVFTCRPSDYLAPGGMAGALGPLFADSDDGFVRAIDLGRAVQR